MADKVVKKISKAEARAKRQKDVVNAAIKIVRKEYNGECGEFTFTDQEIGMTVTINQYKDLPLEEKAKEQNGE